MPSEPFDFDAAARKHGLYGYVPDWAQAAHQASPDAIAYGREMYAAGQAAERERCAPKTFPHEWMPSRLGHGVAQCAHCLATEREISVIGDLNNCERHPDRKAAPPPGAQR